MANDEARALRQQGIAAAKAGQKDEARSLLQQAIRLEPNSEAGWMWLASVARDQRERVFALQKLLELNPGNATARQALDTLLTAAGDAPPSATPARAPALPTAPDATAAPAPSASADTSQAFTEDPSAVGVPLPGAEAVAAAERRAAELIHDHLARNEAPAVNWTPKTRGRAGERDFTVLRLQIAAVVALAVFVLIGLGLVVVNTNADVRALVFAPTATFTYTPTSTPSPTPGVTPTPSPEPRVPPTETPVPPVYMAGADLYNLPQATAIYPPILDRPLEQAVVALDRGRSAAALPTLAAERRLTQNEFRAQPYYYEARALIAEGELADARVLLEEAEERITGRTANTDRALIESGFAQLALAEAEAAEAANQRSRVRAGLEEAAERAASATELDARLPEPYIVQSRVLRRDRDFDAALEILNAGLDQRALPSNVDLLVEKGRVYLDQREYDLADAQAALALYIDPRTAPAHELRIAASMAENRPGAAVLQIQDYLHYLPGSAQAWRLLGDARRAEGNDDLALVAYSQALAGDDPDVERDVLVARAELYAAHGRWDLAREDLTDALALHDDPAIRARRMIAAYRAGRYAVAADDAEALAETDVLPEAELDLWTAMILVDGADGDSAAPYRQALNLLAPLTSSESDLPGALRPAVNEYLARAHLGGNDPDTALGFINQALQAGETPARHLVRGLIFEAQDEIDAARQEYGWVLTLNDIAPVAAAAKAAERLDALAD